ncbi:MAG: biopolymer transporter ExbD [Pirellulales bacterium]|nr:biopolymer transporter ExbD [Pirellulales bacterium]
MRRRRKKKRRGESEVTLNLAAMLDMAFQLLTFFILTFRPSPVEGDVMLRLPPPMPTVVSEKAEEAGSNEKNTSLVQGMNTLTITVLGSPNGSIHQIMFGSDTPIAGLGALDAKLRATFGDPNVAIDQVILQVGSLLSYDQLMQVIDVCTRQKLPSGDRLSKLSLVEAPQ